MKKGALPAAANRTVGWPWIETDQPGPKDASDDNHWPKVSIVTPSFNQGEFLEETIRSVLLQDYPDLEYFVIDGGSTDHSVDVIRRYGPWLAGWVSEPDDGQVDAIRKGFSRATGNILAWLNSDDTYEPNAVMKAVAQLAANPQACAVYSNCHYIDEHSRRRGLYRADDFSVERQFFYRNAIPQPTVFMQADAYYSAGGLDPRFRFILDFDLWRRMAEIAPMVRIPETWANYRLWAESHTVARSEHFLHEQLALYTELAADSQQPSQQRALARRAMATTHLRLAKAFSDRQEWQQAFEEIETAKSIVPPDEWAPAWWTWVGSVLSRRGQSRIRRGKILRGVADIIHGSYVSPPLLRSKAASLWNSATGKSRISMDRRL